MVSLNAESLLGQKPAPFLAESFGIGTTNVLIGTIQRSGLGNISAPILQAVAGILLVKFGGKAHALVESYGVGVLKQLAGGLIGGAIGGAGGVAAAGGTGSPVFGGA